MRRLGWNRVLTGAILAGYIIVYGQCQSYTPQLVTGPLKQTPPNKLTEVLWGVINCIPTIVMAIIAFIYVVPPQGVTAAATAALSLPSG